MNKGDKGSNFSSVVISLVTMKNADIFIEHLLCADIILDVEGITETGTFSG